MAAAVEGVAGEVEEEAAAEAVVVEVDLHLVSDRYAAECRCPAEISPDLRRKIHSKVWAELAAAFHPSIVPER